MLWYQHAFECLFLLDDVSLLRASRVIGWVNWSYRGLCWYGFGYQALCFDRGLMVLKVDKVLLNGQTYAGFLQVNWFIGLTGGVRLASGRLGA